MPKPPAPDEWDQLVVKIGTLTLAVGILEMAIISMVCRILGQAEVEIGIRNNSQWCKKFIEVAPASWSNVEKADLEKLLGEIRALYRCRNQLIHAALGRASDGSIAGVPAGMSPKYPGIAFSESGVVWGFVIWTEGAIAINRPRPAQCAC
jgi:hypothetical protein